MAKKVVLKSKVGAKEALRVSFEGALGLSVKEINDGLAPEMISIFVDEFERQGIVFGETIDSDELKDKVRNVLNSIDPDTSDQSVDLMVEALVTE